MIKIPSYHIFLQGFYVVLLILILSNSAFAQNMSINKNGAAPDASAMLDVQSNNQGILIPRMTQAQRLAITSPAYGLMVLQSNLNEGLYIYDTAGAGLWRQLVDSVGIANMIAAQSGGDSTRIIDADNDTKIQVEESNDEDVIRFDVGGNEVLTIDSAGRLNIFNSGRSVFIGEDAGRLDDYSNNEGVFIGRRAGYNQTSGLGNVAIGGSALYSNTSQSNLTAVGYQALQNNTGFGNTAIGASSLSQNTNGNRNTALGQGSSSSGSTGSDNTNLGYSSGNRNNTGSNNVSIGSQADFYNQGGSDNVMIGKYSGYVGSLHSKSRDVFIGNYAGYNETGSDKLYIENSSSSTPLIYGDFAADSLVINGLFTLDSAKDGSGYTFPGADGNSGQVLQTDGAGNVTWENGGGSSVIPSLDSVLAAGNDANGDSILNLNAIGVNTSTPAYPLEVVGIVKVDTLFSRNNEKTSFNATFGPRVLVSGNSAGGAGNTAAGAIVNEGIVITNLINRDNRVAFQNGTSGFGANQGMAVGQASNAEGFVRQYEDLPIRFYTDNTERMTMLGDGSIGIGNTNPDSLLDVAGGARIENLHVTNRGLFGGDLDMGGNNINNAGFIEMNDQSTLHYGSFSTTQESTMVGSFGGPDAGKTWFNTDSNQLAVWTGNNVVYLDTGAATAGGNTTLDEIADADNDTKIQVEETVDEDILRIDIAGTEYFRINDFRINVLNSGGSVYLGDSAGYARITGGAHTAIGYRALRSMNGSNYNVAVGWNSFPELASGNYNTGVGGGAGGAITSGSGNVLIGTDAATGFQPHSKSGVTAIGREAGLWSTGSYNVYLGYNAGRNDSTASNRLFIENSSSSTPLIYGDFANDSIKIYGLLAVDSAKNGSGYTFPGKDGTSNQVLTTNGSGVVTWENAGGAGDTLSIIQDDDADTKIQVEESGDEDVIRFDVEGVEYFVMDSGRIQVLNTGGSVFLGENAGLNDDLTTNANTFVGADAGRTNTSGFFNTFVGNRSGYSNTIGNYNTFSGFRSGHNNTTGGLNTFLGYYAGHNNTTASYNTFVGNSAGTANTTGAYNAFFGSEAGVTNTTGSNNTYLGYRAGRLATTGYSNVMTGHTAGENTTTGYENIFTGVQAGRYNTTGFRNVFIGRSAGTDNTTGTLNTFVGYQAGVGNSTGSENTAFGQSALRNQQTGDENVAIGYNAGGSNSAHSKTGNVYLGYEAGFGDHTDDKLYIENSSDDRPLIWGDFADDSLRIHGRLTLDSAAGHDYTFPGKRGFNGQVLTSDGAGHVTWESASGGNDTARLIADIDYDTKIQVEESTNEDIIRFDVNGNEVLRIHPFGRLNITNAVNGVFLGSEAGSSIIAGGQNTFLGYEAGTNTTNNSNNTFVGYRAGYISNAAANTVVGSTAGDALTSGARNTMLGQQAGSSTNAGSENVFIGQNAGRINATGANNVYVGTAAGDINTGSDNVFLGNNAGAAVASGSDLLYIANSNDATPLIYGDFANDSLQINGQLNINGAYVFPTVAGTNNQVLKTDGNGNLTWQNDATGGSAGDEIADADNDTKIQVEESGDEDMIRFDIAGDEYYRMEQGRIVTSNSGGSILIGTDAGLNDDLGGNNSIALGDGALEDNTGGGDNVALGNDALNKNLGDRNIAIGKNALKDLDNTSYDGNVAIGFEAGKAADGSNNIYLGYQAGSAATGDNKLYIDNSATNDPLIYGDFDGDSVIINDILNIAGEYSFPTVNGNAGEVLVARDNGQSFWGYGTELSDADNDTRITVEDSPDEDSIRFELAGTEYFVFGKGHINVMNTGKSVFLGNGAGENDNLGGRSNIAIGEDALNTNVSANQNIAIGEDALVDNIANQNVAIGVQSLSSLDNSSYIGNVAVGYRAGQTVEGIKNIFIGHEAGRNANGDNKLYIDNSDTDEPLIYGDFDIDSLVVNGRLTLDSAQNGSGYTFPGTDGTSGQVLTTNGAGQLTWSAGGSDNDWTVSGGIVHNTTNRFAVGTSALPGSYFSEIQTPAGATYSAAFSIDHDYTGAAQQFGLLTNLAATSTGEKYGIYNSVNSNASQANPTFGTLNRMSVNGSAKAYGSYSQFLGSTSDTTYGFYATGEDMNYFSGDVGIGTDAPSEQLTISGGLYINGNSGQIELIEENGGDRMIIGRGIGSGYIQTHDSEPFGINSLGNNIGLGSLAPSEKVEVYNGNLSLKSNPGNRSDLIYKNQTGGELARIWSDEYLLKLSSYDTNSPVVIDTFGRVGIGTTNPLSNLHVNSSTTQAVIRLTNSSTASNGLWLLSNNTGSVLVNYEATSLKFGTSGADRMTISAAGDVGIGTTSPTSTLDVNGDIETGSSDAFYFGDPTTNGTWRITRSGNNLVFERRESGSWVTKTSMVP